MKLTTCGRTMADAMRMPPVKSGDTIASAPARLALSELRTSCSLATTRAFGLSSLTDSDTIRLWLSSPVTAKTPAAANTPARRSASSSAASACRWNVDGSRSSQRSSAAWSDSITTKVRRVLTSSSATLLPTRPMPQTM